MIDRLHPRCQGGPATPMLTKAEIKEQQELNYTFSKDLCAGGQEGRHDE